MTKPKRVSDRLNSVTGEMDRLGKAIECQHQHMRVFNKYDLPYRLHSVSSIRIPSLILDVDLTWRTFFRKDPLWNSEGSHGWDNLYQEMQAIFVAHGPSFKSNYVSKPFENIELYNLMCALVNVTPAANNGTWGALHHLLVNPPAVDLEDNASEMPQILRIDDDYDLVAYDRRQDVCNRLSDYVQTEASSEEYYDERVGNTFARSFLSFVLLYLLKFSWRNSFELCLKIESLKVFSRVRKCFWITPALVANKFSIIVWNISIPYQFRIEPVLSLCLFCFIF